MTEHFLVATDLSADSDLALNEAAAFAPDRLTALYVIPRLATAGVDPLFPSNALQAALDAPALEARAIEAVRARVEATIGERPVDVILRVGDADDQIVKAATEVGATVVALGSHGRSALRRMLLGSVAERVTRASRADVLIARASSGSKVIVVGTDLSRAAEAALDVGVAEAKRRSARLVLTHAIEDPRALAYSELAAAFGVTSMGPAPELEAEVRHSLESILARKLDGSNVIGEVVITSGAAAAEVVRVAESSAAELVVIGHGNKSTLERLAIGSVAEKVARHAHASVYVAHASTRIAARHE